MMIISERINGLFKSIGKAIDNKDANAIQKVVIRQIECGANALDLNIGPGRGTEGPDTMKWLVQAVQEVTDLPLSIDSPSIKTLEAGLGASKNSTIINSTTAEMEKMAKIFPLAAQYNSDIICLTMDERGVPNDADSRAEMAMLMIMTAMEYGVMPEKILLDPLILPVSAAQDQGKKVIESLKMFQILNDPAPRTVVGLSNISNGASDRSLINRTFFAMLAGAGLTAAIMDPEDKELMDVMKTTDILLNNKLYCNGYLRD
ncbi:MAG: dihydropteroate synthase [Candidatus Methanomethylophilaceae archaeon]